jgi:hypothetical protein
MAILADRQGLALQGRHFLNPDWLFPSAFDLEVGQFPDVLLPRSSMMASVVSAFRISRTFPRRHQVHLSPFAM